MIAPPVIFLDSGPLGLLVQRYGVKSADECRDWAVACGEAGIKIFVPEIVDYELRRELLRLGLGAAIARLDAFLHDVSDRCVPLNTRSLHMAAELWADVRRRGIPTSSPDALDVDVILAAQALAEGYDPSEFVVASSNVAHLNRLVPAAIWTSIAPSK